MQADSKSDGLVKKPTSEEKHVWVYETFYFSFLIES